MLLVYEISNFKVVNKTEYTSTQYFMNEVYQHSWFMHSPGLMYSALLNIRNAQMYGNFCTKSTTRKSLPNMFSFVNTEKYTNIASEMGYSLVISRAITENESALVILLVANWNQYALLIHFNINFLWSKDTSRDWKRTTKRVLINELQLFLDIHKSKWHVIYGST